jgi:hypothetical protein
MNLIWLLAQREKLGLKVFEKSVQRKTFGLKRAEITAD